MAKPSRSETKGKIDAISQRPLLQAKRQLLGMGGKRKTSYVAFTFAGNIAANWSNGLSKTKTKLDETNSSGWLIRADIFAFSC